MLIDWLKFGPALVLLLTPIALFHGKRVRFRTIPSGFEHFWGRTFALGLHWIDFGRAILGAWLLAEALTRAPDVQGALRYVVLLTQLSVLSVAMLLQTFVCKEVDAANPPFAFVAGVVLGFLPAGIAAFALFVAVMAALGLRSPPTFFPILSLAIVGAGTLFTGTKLLLPLAIVASPTIVPWLFTLLFPRHFVIAYAAKPAGTRPHAETK